MKLIKYLYFSLFFLLVFNSSCLGSEISSWPDGLIITPAKNDLELEIGNEYSYLIRLINNQAETIAIEVLVDELPKFLTNENKLKSAFHPREYLFPEIFSLELKPDQHYDLPIMVKLPANYPGGGYSGMITFNSRKINGNNSSTQVVSSLSSIFLIKAIGQGLKESGQLDSFTIPFNYFLRTTWPKYFEINFSNQGNVHLNPAGEIQISHFNKNLTVIPVGIFPAYANSKKSLKINWQNSNKNILEQFGFYHASLKLFRGYGDSYDEKNLYFIIIPKLFFLIFGILLFLFLLIKKYYKY